MDIDGGVLPDVAPGQRFGEVVKRSWMIGVALRTQCKGFVEQGSDGVDVLRIISNETFEAGPREVAESRCAVRMVDRTLV